MFVVCLDLRRYAADPGAAVVGPTVGRVGMAAHHHRPASSDPPVRTLMQAVRRSRRSNTRHHRQSFQQPPASGVAAVTAAVNTSRPIEQSTSYAHVTLTFQAQARRTPGVHIIADEADNSERAACTYIDVPSPQNSRARAGGWAEELKLQKTYGGSRAEAEAGNRRGGATGELHRASRGGPGAWRACAHCWRTSRAGLRDGALDGPWAAAAGGG